MPMFKRIRSNWGLRRLEEEAVKRGNEAGLYELPDTFLELIQPRLAKLAAVRFGTQHISLPSYKEEIGHAKSQQKEADTQATLIRHQHNLTLKFQTMPGWRLAVGTVACIILVGLGLELSMEEVGPVTWAALAAGGGFAFTLFSLEPSLLARWSQGRILHKAIRQVGKWERKVLRLTQQESRERDRVKRRQAWIDQQYDLIEKTYRLARTRGEGAKMQKPASVPVISPAVRPVSSNPQDPDFSALFADGRNSVSPEKELTLP